MTSWIVPRLEQHINWRSAFSRLKKRAWLVILTNLISISAKRWMEIELGAQFSLLRAFHHVHIDSLRGAINEALSTHGRNWELNDRVRPHARNLRGALHYRIFTSHVVAVAWWDRLVVPLVVPWVMLAKDLKRAGWIYLCTLELIA